MGRIVHFELPSSDMAASRKFYEKVFGWKFTPYGEGAMEYWLVTTGEDSEPGINGGLGGAANEFKATVNTVGVDNIDEALRLVAANGGQVIMPKDVIPNMGYLAYVREPGGGVVGLFQELPSNSS
jgi:uncharacterized protein